MAINNVVKKLLLVNRIFSANKRLLTYCMGTWTHAAHDAFLRENGNDGKVKGMSRKKC